MYSRYFDCCLPAPRSVATGHSCTQDMVSFARCGESTGKHGEPSTFHPSLILTTASKSLHVAMRDPVALPVLDDEL